MQKLQKLFHKHEYKLVETVKSPTTDKADARTCIIKHYKCKCGKVKTKYEVIDKPYFYDEDVLRVLRGEITLKEMCYNKGIMKEPILLPECYGYYLYNAPKN